MKDTGSIGTSENKRLGSVSWSVFVGRRLTVFRLMVVVVTGTGTSLSLTAGTGTSLSLTTGTGASLSLTPGTSSDMCNGTARSVGRRLTVFRLMVVVLPCTGISLSSTFGTSSDR